MAPPWPPFGLEVNVITAAEAKDMWPLLETRDLVGAVHLPKDGQTNPVDTTQALARGARSRGVKIFENCRVTAINTANGRVTGVQTAAGTIRARIVVIAAGCGHAILPGGWMLACRFMPPSIFTSSPNRCPA